MDAEGNNSSGHGPKAESQKFVKFGQNRGIRISDFTVSRLYPPTKKILGSSLLFGFRLQAESQTWQSLLRPPPEHSLQLPPLPVEMKPQQINPDTLSGPGQRAALSLISSASSHSTSSLAKVASTRLRNINQGLEFEVDRFGNNVHAIRMYKEVADRVAGEMLGMCSKALQERDVEGIHLSTQKAGGEPTTRDVLRTLSRTIDR